MEDIYTYKYTKYKHKYLELKGGMKKTCTEPWNFNTSELSTIFIIK